MASTNSTGRNKTPKTQEFSIKKEAKKSDNQ
jgi:hypothetical protein